MCVCFFFQARLIGRWKTFPFQPSGCQQMRHPSHQLNLKRERTPWVAYFLFCCGCAQFAPSIGQKTKNNNKKTTTRLHSTCSIFVRRCDSRAFPLDEEMARHWSTLIRRKAQINQVLSLIFEPVGCFQIPFHPIPEICRRCTNGARHLPNFEERLLPPLKNGYKSSSRGPWEYFNKKTDENLSTQLEDIHAECVLDVFGHSALDLWSI